MLSFHLKIVENLIFTNLKHRTYPSKEDKYSYYYLFLLNYNFAKRWLQRYILSEFRLRDDIHQIRIRHSKIKNYSGQNQPGSVSDLNWCYEKSQYTEIYWPHYNFAQKTLKNNLTLLI